ncbi:uncharacterized protein LOC111318960, partial [Stylophora pistillata]|uniref:uncharacterized protein LOC111318960 n=1 Tax=Stylophora pistillata TaxID=50429 RepID=UPI000C045D0D
TPVEGPTLRLGGQAEVKKLLVDDPSSGYRLGSLKSVLLITDGQSNIQRDLTIFIVKELKNRGVAIFVVAAGFYINGIDEMVKLSTNQNTYLLRVETVRQFYEVTRVISQKAFPDQ